MRRSLAFAGSLLAVALVVVPVLPASAIEVAPPPPVSEVPYKPSTLVEGTGRTESGAEIRARLLQESRAARLPPPAVPGPVAPGFALSRLSGPIAAVTFAPMFVEGAVKVLAISAEGKALGIEGETYEDIICSGIGSTDQDGFLSWLYGSRDCYANITDPDADQPQTYTGQGCYLTMCVQLAGVIYEGLIYSGAPIKQVCAKVTGLISGYDVRFPFALTTRSNHTALDPGYPLATCPSGFSTYGPAGLYNLPRMTSPFTLGDMKIQTGSGTVMATIPESDLKVQAHPDRTLKCDVTMSDGSHLLGTGLTFQEGDGLPIGSDATGCTQALEDFVSDPGSPLYPERIKIDSDDGTSITTVADEEVPAESNPNLVPESNPRKNEGLRLLKTVGVDVLSCMTWEADCADWWAESDSGTDNSEYFCTFQGENVDLLECGVYRHTFEDSENITITDPDTEEEIGWGTDPGADNSTDPASGPTPGDRCMASWSSAPNPLEWVMTPVKCALVWAFVPRANKVAESRARISEEVDNTLLGTIAGALTGLSESFQAGVGCGGLPFHLEGPGWEVNAMLLASCEEPAAGIAATVRTILSGVIIAGGILAFIRYLGALFGFTAFGRNNSEAKGATGPSFD